VRTALHSARCLLIFLLLFSRVPGATQALREGQLVQPKTEGSVRVIYFGPSLSAQSRYKSLSSAKKDGLPLNPDVLRREVSYPTLEVRGSAVHCICLLSHVSRYCRAIPFPLHIFLGAFGPCFGQ
jgi:hypothetical protein